LCLGVPLMSVMDSEQAGTLFILVGLLVYGLHPVVVEFGGGYLAPFFFASVSSVAAGCGALLLARFAGGRGSGVGEERGEGGGAAGGVVPAGWGDRVRLVLAGVLGTFVAFGCLFVALQLTTSNSAAVVLRSELAFALIFGYLFLGERISLRQGAWIGLMIGGVLLVVFRPVGWVWSVGDLLLVVTPAAWSGGHTLAKPVLERVSAWTVVGFRNLVGGLLLLAAALGLAVLGCPVVLVPDFGVVAGVLAAEALVILLGHGLWYAGIGRINLGKATALIAPAPLVTFMFSSLLLGVPPTGWQLLGAGMVMAATILLAKEESLRRCGGGRRASAGPGPAAGGRKVFSARL